MRVALLYCRRPLYFADHLTLKKIAWVQMGILAFTALSVGLWAQPAVVAQAQETRPSAAPSAQAPAEEKKPPKKGKSHQYDFLLIGTVFTEKGLSLEGAQLRVRRAGEKKFRWETLTDRRGEFAVRVKQGADYEIVVRAKGFQEQTRTVDAKSGDREDLNFHLAPALEGKRK